MYLLFVTLALCKAQGLFDSDSLSAACKERQYLLHVETDTYQKGGIAWSEFTERREANNSVLRDYIFYAFGSKDMSTLCKVNDSLVDLVNEMARNLAGENRGRHLAEVILSEGSKMECVWELDSIVMRDVEFARKWTKRFGNSPTFLVMDELVKNLVQGDPLVWTCYGRMLETADGEFAEYLVEKTKELLLAEPAAMVSGCKYLAPKGQLFVEGVLKDYLDPVERGKALEIYGNLKKDATVERIIGCLKGK